MNRVTATRELLRHLELVLQQIYYGFNSPPVGLVYASPGAGKTELFWLIVNNPLPHIEDYLTIRPRWRDDPPCMLHTTETGYFAVSLSADTAVTDREGQLLGNQQWMSPNALGTAIAMRLVYQLLGSVQSYDAFVDGVSRYAAHYEHWHRTFHLDEIVTAVLDTLQLKRLVLLVDSAEQAQVLYKATRSYLYRSFTDDLQWVLNQQSVLCVHRKEEFQREANLPYKRRAINMILLPALPYPEVERALFTPITDRVAASWRSSGLPVSDDELDRIRRACARLSGGHPITCRWLEAELAWAPRAVPLTWPVLWADLEISAKRRSWAFEEEDILRVMSPLCDALLAEQRISELFQSGYMREDHKGGRVIPHTNRMVPDHSAHPSLSPLLGILHSHLGDPDAGTAREECYAALLCILALVRRQEVSDCPFRRWTECTLLDGLCGEAGMEAPGSPKAPVFVKETLSAALKAKRFDFTTPRRVRWFDPVTLVTLCDQELLSAVWVPGAEDTQQGFNIIVLLRPVGETELSPVFIDCRCSGDANSAGDICTSDV